MEVQKEELSSERLPNYYKNDYISTIINEIETNENLTQEELFERLELVLVERAQCACFDSTPPKANTLSTSSSTKRSQLSKLECHCYSVENKFILGQFYFDRLYYEKAYEIFDEIKEKHTPALFQLAVILYDDLVDEKKDEVVDTKVAVHHKNKENWKRAFMYMKVIADFEMTDQLKELIHAAQYNVGKAYYQGFGVKQSDYEAEKYWLMSADDGSPRGCISAMVGLAFFYSRKSEPEFFDLKKAFFWHNEACGNGSLESQGALGAMYYYGIGAKQDLSAAYECLTNSSERGNVYSMGILSDYYFRHKFFAKAYDLSKKVAELNNIDHIARETKCLRSYIAKGIALASFTQARCLDLGKGVEKDSKEAKKYYKRSFYFDPDLCQVYQTFTTLCKC